MASPASGPAAETAEPDEIHPILGVFISPSAAMNSLARRPRFLVALVVMTVIACIGMGLAYQKGITERSIRVQMENEPRIERLPPDQRERAIDQAARIGSTVALVAGFIGPVLGLLVVGSVLFGVTRLLGAAPSYKQVLAIVSHSWLPLSLQGLIGIPILLAKEPDMVDFQNIVSMSNLGFLFSPSEQKRLYMIGTSIDLFSFWTIGLLTLGLSRITGKPKSTVLPAILGLWALYVVLFKALKG